MKPWMCRYIGIAAMMLASHPAFASGVVVTIKPLHSLVAGVMEGDDIQPVVLVSGKESLHDFSLRPSQVKALKEADVVFYISPRFELFMDEVAASLPTHVRLAAMDKTSDLRKFPVRYREEHPHEEDHGKDNIDLHVWLWPDNAKAMVMEIARQLAITYPNKRERYFANARTLSDRLDAMFSDMEGRMVKLTGKPFVTFHDALQYFDTYYHLQAVGAVTLHPEYGVSAKHVSELRETIKKTGAICVFREPQFEGKVVDNLLQGLRVRSGMVDPEGALLAPGKEFYFQLMEGLASGLERCLLSS